MLDCDIDDCYVCAAVAGRCDGRCDVCDQFDELFPFWAGTGGRCTDCRCPGCAARRRGVLDDARGDSSDPGGFIPGAS